AEDDSAEIAYFGIVVREFGRGFGKHLLSCAVRDAWALGPRRVWLHTCTLDHPNALPNYLARGFTPYRTETYEVDSRSLISISISSSPASASSSSPGSCSRRS